MFFFVPPAGAQSDGTKNAYTAFVTALSALTAASNNLIQNERNAGRLTKIRQTLTAELLAKLPIQQSPPPPPVTTPSPTPTATQVRNTTISLRDALDEASLLCDFRSKKMEIVAKGDLSQRDKNASITIDQLETVAAQNYLNLVLSELKAITPPNATDIPSALKELFASYQIKAPSSSLLPDAVEKSRKGIEANCEDDLKEFEAAYYGKKIQIGPAVASAPSAASTGLPSLSFLGPAGSAFDTIVGIISPVFIGVANFIARVEQEQAIYQYLNQSGIQDGLNLEGDRLGRTESDYLFAQRLSLAGAFAEELALIRSTTIDLAKIDDCAAPSDVIAGRSPKGLPSLEFRACYHAVWSKYQSAVDDALKAAAAYDQVADAGDTNTALNSYNNIMKKYNEIAASRTVLSPDAFWSAVSQIVAFAGAVSDATSASNLAKLKKAIDSLK
jgi:hypothetical protein